MLFKDYDFPCRYEKPLALQVKTVINLIKYRYFYCLSTMGTGKTLSCLWASDFLAMNAKIRRVLIVAPLSTLESVWADEIFHHLRTRRAVILHHYNKAKRVELLEHDCLYYIINHDGIKLIEKELRKKKFDVIIVDELTAFRNNNSDRTKCMKRICRTARAVWGLTGSMTSNKVTDAFGQAQVVNPYNEALPEFYTVFRDLLTIKLDEYTDVPRNGWEKILYPMIQPSIRFKLDDCTDLPPIVYEHRDVEMTKEMKGIYTEMKKQYIVELEEGVITAANAGVKIMKLMQISCGAVFDNEGNLVQINNSNKLKELIELYSQLDTKKLIIFCNFKGSLKNVLSFLRGKGITAEAVHGGVSRTARTKIFHDFQHGTLNTLVMQPAASAHGLTLTAASTICWFGPVTSNEIFRQANARIRRPGQTRKQLVVMLQSSPVERKFFRALETKEANSNMFLSLIEDQD